MEEKGAQEVQEEYEARKEYGYDGTYIPADKLSEHTDGKYYTSGVRYSNCFAINPMLFCQEMKYYLQEQGVQKHHSLREIESFGFREDQIVH